MTDRDRIVLGIQVADCVAMAQLLALESQSGWLSDLARLGAMSKQDAVDMAYTAALAAGMVHRHGADVIQEILANAFDEAVAPSSVARAA